MLGHYVALALRSTARTKLYTAISVVGLAIGFAAATLLGLYVHDELSYDRWLPNHERIYQVSAGLSTGLLSNAAPSDLGVWLASDYPQLEAVTRMFVDRGFLQGGQRADFKSNETFTWADPNVFEVFQFSVVAGSLDGALDRPDSLVLVRRTAEKYFGRAESAIGRTLLYNGTEPMVVTAVIADLPSNTHLNPLGVLAPSHAPFSAAALQDRTPITVFGGKLWNSRTYVLLKPNEPIAPIRESLKTLLDRHAPTVLGGNRKASEVWALVARPLGALHLSSNSIAEPDGERHASLYAVAAIGLLILLIASINYVNLLTAIGVRRALEVGVRKALGAQRRDLFVQFMTESYLYVALGAAVGLGAAALALKPLNAFLGRTIDFSMFADARVATLTVVFLALVAFLAGLYPALVLSAYRPATVAKGGRTARAQAGVRQVLVVLQFAVLIAMLVATAVTYRQMKLGMREALRQNTDPILVLQGGCTEALKSELERQPGVVGAACAMGLPQWGFQMMAPMIRADREPLGIRYLPVDFGFFELYGNELAAGRLFDRTFATDASPPDNIWKVPESVVINERAARALGFGSAEEAVGQVVSFSHLFRAPATFTPLHETTIIGVLKDFQIGPVTDPIQPAAFYVDLANARMMSVKLSGLSTPEALETVDRVWNRFNGAPPQRFFFSDAVQNIYVDLLRQTALFSTFALIAVLIAVLGLVGLAAHAAASRTKEIGIRKVLGGGRWTITGLLLWQFSRPVLLANVVAWPVAYFSMTAWLGGFAKRVGLDWWLFAGAGGITLAVAVAAVLAHTWGMAGVRPVKALRYE
jgi:putative ABC transport system permease protein